MENRFSLWIVACTVLGLLNACIQFPTVNQDPSKNNAATYNRELQECKQDYPETSSGAHLRQWVNCMRLKGWQ